MDPIILLIVIQIISSIILIPINIPCFALMGGSTASAKIGGHEEYFARAYDLIEKILQKFFQ